MFDDIETTIRNFQRGWEGRSMSLLSSSEMVDDFIDELRYEIQRAKDSLDPCLFHQPGRGL
jgi:hypothetical protein